jgi:AcrR family transcriptional regulator
MPRTKEDRRIKKTKQLLKSGLVELMSEKDVQNITIKELVEKVDINRSTFYLHYTDIYELLKEIEDNLMEEIWEVFNTYKNIEHLEESYAFLLTLYKTFEKNRGLCKVLVSNRSNASFIQSMEESMEQEIRRKLQDLIGSPDLIAPNSYIFYRCGCIGLLKYWITTDAPESPEEMAKETYHIVVDSLNRIKH